MPVSSIKYVLVITLDKRKKDGADFSDQFGKIIMRYKRIGAKLNVTRQDAC